MNWHSWLSLKVRGVKRLTPLIPLVLLAGLFMAAPVQAQGGIAISGSFYRQPFEIPQGVSVSGPSIYVVVLNHSDEELGVRMTTEAPFGVNIILSQDDFILQPGGQQKVLIEVEVTQDAVAGEYEISVTAETYKEGTGGIQVMGAAGQRATLLVLGESASVTVQVVSPDEQPVVAVVRLFKVIAGQNYEFAYSETGTLKAKVSPGFYTASAYVAGEKLAEESFNVIAGETKNITLTVKTVYFSGFGIVPNYYTETGELAFAQIVYQVGNLYQPIADVELILKISLDGEALEEVSLLSLSELTLGDISGSRDYIPPQGWESGTYTFQAELYVGGKLYTTSLEEKLEVTAPPAALMVSWAVLGGIIGAMLIIIAVIASVMLVRRRRALRSLG